MDEYLFNLVKRIQDKNDDLIQKFYKARTTLMDIRSYAKCQALLIDDKKARNAFDHIESLVEEIIGG